MFHHMSFQALGIKKLQTTNSAWHRFFVQMVPPYVYHHGTVIYEYTPTVLAFVSFVIMSRYFVLEGFVLGSKLFATHTAWEIFDVVESGIMPLKRARFVKMQIAD